MSRFYIAFFIMVVFFFLVEWYAYQAIKAITKQKLYHFVWIGIMALVYAQFLFQFINALKMRGQTPAMQLSFGIILMFLIPKIIVILFLFGEDVTRLAQKIMGYFSGTTTHTVSGRRKFISQLALGLAAIPFASFLYGILKGKYNYKVLKYELEYDDLPESFNGFTITQISDIHSGSFTNKEKVQYAVDLVNKQQSDVVLFTGDIVNNFAYEMDNFIDVFKQIKAPDGCFSVLGNHDYGDYAKWETKKDRFKNFNAIKAIHPKIGFDLLLNENRFIEKNGERIAIVGVENWGKGWKQAGDLKKATQTVSKDDFKILLSHDPSHWEHVVKKDNFNYHLTLSGHTHGLQMGIEIPGFIKWSPVKYVYKQWAGLYKEQNRYINVNRGFGFHGFSGRTGIWPEITVIRLKKKQRS